METCPHNFLHSFIVLLLCLSGFAQSVGNITTVAGTGTGGYAGDGGLSTSAKVFAPFGVAVDKAGNFYIAGTGNNRVRKVSLPSYVITTVAGNGKNSFCGVGGPATSVCLNQPTGVALDSAGNLYIADNANSRVRKVDTRARSALTPETAARRFVAMASPQLLPVCILRQGLPSTAKATSMSRTNTAAASAKSLLPTTPSPLWPATGR